jgi:hypothetical protein
MQAPPCPQPNNFGIISGFVTPATDSSPHRLDASITVDILDPIEDMSPVRIVEVDDPFAVAVAWCICGPNASAQNGCWDVNVYIDDIDGVGSTHGRLASTTVSASGAPTMLVNDTGQRCYEYTFTIPAGKVTVGVYRLVVVVTYAAGPCEMPGPLLRDMFGYAEIPALLFYG